MTVLGYLLIFAFIVTVLFPLAVLVFCKNRQTKKYCASYLCLGTIAVQYLFILNERFPTIYFIVPAVAYLFVLAITMFAFKATVHITRIFTLAACAQAAAYGIYFNGLMKYYSSGVTSVASETFYVASETFYQAIALLLGILVISAFVVIWQPFFIKDSFVPTFVIVLFVVATLDCGVNYYLNETADEYEFGIATSKYQPFFPKTLVKLLDEPSALSFVHHLPRMDGDIELYPLYTAFARAAYPSAYYDPYDTSGKSAVACDSYDKIRRLVEGDSDIAFMANVTEKDYKTAADAGLELNLLPIGKEALVFFVNSKNRVNGLSQEEVLQIYSGEIWNWSYVKDGKASGAITPYQPGFWRGETEAFKKIMSGVKLMKPPEIIYFDGKPPYLSGYAAEYRNRKNALGIAYRFLVEETLDEAQRKGIKLLKIDGVEPSIENISSGAYPYSNYFYAVTIKNRPFDKGDIETKARIVNTQKLLDWILSEQGQGLVEKTGYSPL